MKVEGVPLPQHIPLLLIPNNRVFETAVPSLNGLEAYSIPLTRFQLAALADSLRNLQDFAHHLDSVTSTRYWLQRGGT
jgi:hypothetical protein